MTSIVTHSNKEAALEMVQRTRYQGDVPISYLNPQSVQEGDIEPGLISHYQNPEQAKDPMFRQKDKALRELLKANDSHVLQEKTKQPLNLLKFAGTGEGPRNLSTEKHTYKEYFKILKTRTRRY